MSDKRKRLGWMELGSYSRTGMQDLGNSAIWATTWAVLTAVLVLTVGGGLVLRFNAGMQQVQAEVIETRLTDTGSLAAVVEANVSGETVARTVSLVQTAEAGEIVTLDYRPAVAPASMLADPQRLGFFSFAWKTAAWFLGISLVVAALTVPAAERQWQQQREKVEGARV